MSEVNGFEMVDCPVASLDGKALDYAVAIVEGGHSLRVDGFTWWVTLEGLSRVLGQGWGSIGYQPSIEWQHGGPIIGRAQIGLRVNIPCSPGRTWEGRPSPLARGAGGKGCWRQVRIRPHSTNSRYAVLCGR